MSRTVAFCLALLATTNCVLAGPKALSACPGSASGAASPLSGGNVVVDGVTATVVIVQSSTSGYAATPYGAVDFGNGDGALLGTGGCIQVEVPVGGSLDLLVNSGSKKVHLGALILSSLKISVDSESSVISASPIKVDGPCELRSNSKSRLVMWENSNVCNGAVKIFVDSQSDMALAGTYSTASTGVLVDMLNSKSKLFIGAVPTSVTTKLMDSKAGLRIAGTPTLVVTGSNSPDTTIQLLSGTCGAGLNNCATVPPTIEFWDNGAFFNDPELNS